MRGLEGGTDGCHIILQRYVNKDTMPIHLLLVEDNPGDALLLQHMLDGLFLLQTNSPLGSCKSVTHCYTSVHASLNLQFRGFGEFHCSPWGRPVGPQYWPLNSELIA